MDLTLGIVYISFKQKNMSFNGVELLIMNVIINK